MKTKVKKWGNSLALRIPKAFAVETKLEPGSDIELELENGRLVITPRAEAEWTLERLLAGVTDENIHGETDTGVAVGNEVW